MTFPVVAIDNVRSFSRTCSSARRPLRLIEPVRGYQPPISHANFESWLGGISIAFRTGLKTFISLLG